MRVLVTGASGFIGSHCVPLLLEAGHVVHAAARTPLERPGPVWHSTDLLSQGTPALLISSIKPDALLHLAWCTAPGLYWSSPENQKWAQASAELFSASSVHGCKRIVAAGTSAEYDWSAGVCSETLTPLRPSSLYGTSKVEACLNLRRAASAPGMTWCWGRIFNIYGPGEHPMRLVPSIVRSLMHAEDAEIPVIVGRRDFLHVADVAKALVTLLNSDVAGAVNIGSGGAVGIAEIVRHVGTVLGKRPRVVFDSKSEGVPLVQGESGALRSEAAWMPQFTLEAGIRQTVHWWQRHTSL